jgi:hypothetical protein
MGHGLPNMIGADRNRLQAAIGKAVPDAMVMGTEGMDEPMRMAMPDNTIAMAPVAGPHDVVTMGGMFTVLKVRDRLSGDADPGWYRQPQGSAARPARDAELERDGIAL